MKPTVRGLGPVLDRFNEEITAFGVRGLARELGVSHTFIGKVAKGETPVTERLAELLGFSVETVVTYRKKR